MAIEILEVHHTGIRIDNAGAKLGEVETFYKDVLGLSRDEGRPTIPGIPGAWINVGAVGQLHLFGGNRPSPVAKGPGQDPTRPHVAFAVKDIVATKKELEILRALVDRVAGEVFAERGKTLDYLVGTMIELPRAALMAHEIAEEARFFSFGTNDLTQTTWAFSRDDVEASFVGEYLERGIFGTSPFESIDPYGVGELVGGEHLDAGLGEEVHVVLPAAVDLVVAALATDVVALGAIASRIDQFGVSPNRVAALGENLILLVNLAWSAVLYLRFLRGRGTFDQLERWQTNYLPVYAAWAAFVVACFPLIFG